MSSGGPTTQEASDATQGSMIGRVVLGKYRVKRQIGEGGMGAVYLLQHDELPDTFAALKVDTSTGSAAASRFKQEAHVAASIGSHRVVRPLDSGVFSDGTRYIVMEYVPGKSIAAELKERGPFDVTAALQITVRIAETMTMAHAKSIVHRDLKLQNVMLTTDGGRESMVKLLDFGVARVSGELKMAMTSERSVIGTPGYMSPEAVMGLSVDGRADVFSLGVMLYVMLTEKLPFPGDSVEQLVLAVLEQPIPGIAAHRSPAVPPAPIWLDGVLARALAKKPADRFTMAEFQGALVQALKRLRNESGRIDAAMGSLLSVGLPVDPSALDQPTLAGPTPELDRVLGRLTPDTPSPTAPIASVAPPLSPPLPSSPPTVDAPETMGAAHGRRLWWVWVASLVAALLIAALAALVVLSGRRGPAPAAAPATSPQVTPTSAPPLVVAPTIEARPATPAAPNSPAAAAPAPTPAKPRAAARGARKPAPAAGGDTSLRTDEP